MAIKIVLILVGLIVGFLQYGLIKTIAKYAAEKSGGVFAIIAVKLLLYIVVGVAVFLWFKVHLFAFATGLAAGIVLTAVVDSVKNKKR